MSISRRIASRYPSRFLREYAHWKVRSDPAYEGVLRRLSGAGRPLVDLGCGIGLLALYLREHGVGVPVVGIDFDAQKVEMARLASRGLAEVEFRVADARGALPGGHDFVVLDLLQYFGAADRRRILEEIARAVPPGGVVIIREGIRDGSWRYRITRMVDVTARRLRWMRVDRVDFPTREELVDAFPGFTVEVEPLWGRTPFNNYLFVFRRV